MTPVQIIKATSDRVTALQEISRQTFSDSFSAVNTEENMANYLAEAFSAEKLAAELCDPNSEFYFAEYENTVIGYLKLNHGHAQTEMKDKNAVEMERIYVLKEYQGKNIGQLLYEKAVQVAMERQAEYIWLGVWEENQRAIHFYKKNGFVEFDKHIFKLGDDEQTDIMMKLELGHSNDD